MIKKLTLNNHGVSVLQILFMNNNESEMKTMTEVGFVTFILCKFHTINSQLAKKCTKIIDLYYANDFRGRYTCQNHNEHIMH